MADRRSAAATRATGATNGATNPPAGAWTARDTDPVPNDLTIGELAARSGVTPEAIRYYEREGVIPPAARRGAGHYRRYGARDAERLRFVRRARHLGFSLHEVRELLALAVSDPDAPCDEANRIARAHLAQVETKLAQLAALRAELARLVTECDQDVAVADCRLLGALSGASSSENEGPRPA